MYRVSGGRGGGGGTGREDKITAPIYGVHHRLVVQQPTHIKQKQHVTYGDNTLPPVVYCFPRSKSLWINDLEWVNIALRRFLHVESSARSMHLNSLERCIYTTSMTNIRPGRDSNPVSLRSKTEWTIGAGKWPWAQKVTWSSGCILKSSIPAIFKN